jgi:hypothetical protein
MNKKLTAKTKKNKPAARPTGYVSVAEHWYDVGYKDAQADAKTKRKEQHEVTMKLMNKENSDE